ncbi:protein MKS1-like [Juglans regia]|uniref:Protein MKS1-like n=2 Tax=Juglans regia TaxID=51240 RepID=A0A2I4EAE5_JUGRE|nr:protein MKS1-like [Juglans regia]
MNPLDPRYSPETPKKELQLQGRRPPPLTVSKDSHKIKKPPPHPQPKPPLNPFRPQQQPFQPVIIYAVSPKVIHATVSDFMSIVQRLTGPSSSSSRAGDLSPAARIASIEKTSPPKRNRDRAGSAAAAMGVDPILDDEGVVELGQTYPGILSPAPMTLPPIPDGFFSPTNEPQDFPPFHELMSPFWRNGFFAASPSGLLSAPLISPSPSSLEFLSNFLNF